MGIASWLRYCSDVGQRKPTKLCTMFGRLLGLYSIHFRGLLPRDGIYPGAKLILRPSLALSYIVSVTARHRSSEREPNFAALSRGRHLYSAGWPSCWALAHILVSERMLSPVRLSSVCLSSVPFVRPTQAVQIFGNISTALGILAIHGHPLKILRRSSQGNPSAGGVKDKRGSQI